MGYRIYLTFALLFCGNCLSAQDLKEAWAFFEKKNFEDAIPGFEEAIKNSNDAAVKYRLAVCYLNTTGRKQNAIPLLEELVKDPKSDPNSLYLLGRAYHYHYDFEKAIDAFNKFIRAKSGTVDNLVNAGKQIEYCQNAMELKKYPVEVEKEILSSSVNSIYPDYYPFVPGNESFMLYNSKRNDGSTQKADGHYHSNIYYSKVVDGSFATAELLSGKINLPDVSEEIVGLTLAGDKAVIYTEDAENSGNLSLISIKDGKVVRKEKLPKQINTRSNEIAASINSDGTEIYFASDMPGGFGGIDIYVTRITPKGVWGPVQNLGPAVNTPYDEDFPNISPDGKTLYFSSKGHTSMGGYDIFRADFDETKVRFTRARNLGYPVNTTDDDMNFRLSNNGRYGYLSYVNNEGQKGTGNFDIYRLTFTEVEAENTVYAGKINLPAGATIENISMIVTNEKTGEPMGEYLPNPNTMRYVIVLPPGKFKLNIDIDGMQPHEELIEVLDKSAYTPEINKDIDIKKL